MKQSGAVLLIGLVLLGALSMIGVTGLNGMLFHRAMAGNIEQRHLARQAAAAAERQARAWLAHADDDALAALAIKPNTPPLAESLDTEWWNANATVYKPSSDLQTWWRVETLHSHPALSHIDTDLNYFRILARGEVRTSIAVLEAIVVLPRREDMTRAPYPPPDAAFAPLRIHCEQFEADLPCGQLAWRQRR